MDIDPIQLKCSPIKVEPVVRRCSITGHWRVNDLRSKKGGMCVCAGKRIPFNTSPNIPTRSLSPWQPLDRAVRLRSCSKDEGEELENCTMDGDADDEYKGDDGRPDGGDQEEPYDYSEDPCHVEVCQCCKRRPFIFNNDHIFDRPVNQRICHKYFPPTYLVGSNYAGCTSSYNVNVCEEHINPQSQTCGSCCKGN